MKNEELNESSFQANEPTATYGNAGEAKSIHFFSSLEEMNEYDIREMAATTPLQRLANIVSLIQNLYHEELKKPFTGLSIHFD